MVEDHDSRPGPTNYKRFLRLQREVQTGVGQQAEEKASNLLTAAEQRPSFGRRGKLRSLEATNRALADAIELRAVFHDVTRFVEQLTAISMTLRQTEPRSERDATLIRELQALQQKLTPHTHLPAKVHAPHSPHAASPS